MHSMIKGQNLLGAVPPLYLAEPHLNAVMCMRAEALPGLSLHWFTQQQEPLASAAVIHSP